MFCDCIIITATGLCFRETGRNKQNIVILFERPSQLYMREKG